MFTCQVCRRAVGPGVSPIVKVVETRDVAYSNMQGQLEGKGTEIVRELKVCSGCNSKHWGPEPVTGLVN